jgi:hypothetical protein
MWSAWKAALGLGSAVLLQGCTDVCACTPSLATAVVNGRVTQGGAPTQAGIRTFSADGEGCRSLGVAMDATVAGSDGEFLVELVTDSGLEDVCVYVYARPVGDEDDARSSDTAFVVLDFTADPVPDTATVELALLPE